MGVIEATGVTGASIASMRWMDLDRTLLCLHRTLEVTWEERALLRPFNDVVGQLGTHSSRNFRQLGKE